MSHAPHDITTAWLTWVKKEGLMNKFAVLIFIIIIFAKLTFFDEKYVNEKDLRKY